MQRTSPLFARTLLLGGVALLSACSAALPPQELLDARAAYTQAQNGAAADYAPAKLDGAHQALQEAEANFQEEEGSDKTKALAYVAERRARASAAAGEKIQAERKRADLEKQYAELERKRLTMTKEELEATRARLAEERTRAAVGAMALAQKDKDIAQKEKALAQKDAELAAEREARKAAETKLSAAIASLAELGSIKEEARGVVITLSGSVLFATGKSELLPIAKEKMNEVAVALKDQGYKQIIIEGHTDSQGSASKNEQLSLDRANSVKTHLVSQGLDGSKIEARGLGSSRPVATNDTPDGRANNRRVELVVTPK